MLVSGCEVDIPGKTNSCLTPERAERVRDPRTREVFRPSASFARGYPGGERPVRDPHVSAKCRIEIVVGKRASEREAAEIGTETLKYCANVFHSTKSASRVRSERLGVELSA